MNDTLSTPRSYLSPDDIMEIAGGFMRSRALLTAYELGLFSALGDDWHTSEDAARKIKADARATDRLMNALVAMKLLQKESGRFANMPLASKFLVAGKPGYMAGLAHTSNLWKSWGTLTEAVRAGGAVFESGAPAQDDSRREAFIAAMHYRAKWQAPSIAELVGISRVRRVLDVGGGSGAYSAAFVRMKDDIRATVLDLPEILPLTSEYINDEGLGDRISVEAGDYTKDPLGGGYDLVLLSAVLHSNSPDANRALMRKCTDALLPGGRVVVQDFIMDEERKGPPHAALFALNMLVNTNAGDTYTENEVRGWMMEAGLSGIERRETPFGASVIIGGR